MPSLPRPQTNLCVVPILVYVLPTHALGYFLKMQIDDLYSEQDASELPVKEAKQLPWLPRQDHTGKDTEMQNFHSRTNHLDADDLGIMFEVSEFT